MIKETPSSDEKRDILFISDILWQFTSKQHNMIHIIGPVLHVFLAPIIMISTLST